MNSVRELFWVKE